MISEKKALKRPVMNERYQRLFAGGVAGGLAKTLIAPAERIRILQQIHNKPLISVFRSVLLDEGFLAFWRGNLVNVIRSIPSKGILLASNDYYKDLLRRGRGASYTLSAGEGILCGAACGATSTILTYPLELLRTRVMGFIGENKYNGLMRTIRMTVKEEGLRGFFRGATPTVLGCLPYTGVQFGAYDIIMSNGPKQFDSEGRRSNPLWYVLLGGAFAGILSQMVTYPNELLRRQLMMKNVNFGYLACAKEVFREFGIRGFYSGVPATCLRIGPNTAFQFAFYELIKRLMRRNSEK